MTVLVSLIVLFVSNVVLSENDFGSCQLPDGSTGFCINIENCPYAFSLLKNHDQPQVCGFEGQDPIVCCKNVSENIKEGRKYGEISLKKCDEFYPFNGPIRFGIYQGEISLAREFPHMAAIGYDGEDGVLWGCGGAIISPNFILTAAHCLFSRSSGAAKYVRLGDLDIISTTDDAEPQNFLVKRAIPHPDYNPPYKYHDIGLIELDGSINRTAYVNVACLDAEREHVNTFVVATGWGKTEYAGKPSSALLKGYLGIVSQEECQKYYRNTDKDNLPNGINDESMVCAGGDSDTCQGDSGGPLSEQHATKRTLQRIYNVIGVTSFGKACGIGKVPGVYTRVYNYLNWIEDVVWPN